MIFLFTAFLVSLTRVNQCSHAEGKFMRFISPPYHFAVTKRFIIDEIFFLGHWGSRSLVSVWTMCCTWKLSPWWMTWRGGSSFLICGIWWRIMLVVPSTVIIGGACSWLFGWSCSRRGMFMAVYVDLPLASKAESSLGWAFFLWLRQLEPFAKVLSHLLKGKKRRMIEKFEENWGEKNEKFEKKIEENVFKVI